MMRFRFFEVNDSYIDYCRAFDSIVPDNKIGNRIHTRKFIGIVLKIGDFEYFAPLSSYKPKHEHMRENIDFVKINDHDGGYAVINLNNMIPVPPDAVIEIDIDAETDVKYRSLLQKQFQICRDKRSSIIGKAQRLYEIVTVHRTPRIVNRCCNFKLLEVKCKEFTRQATDTVTLEETAISEKMDK